jgi:hypothetical protein
MLALDFAPLLFVRPVASLSEEFAGPRHWVRRLPDSPKTPIRTTSRSGNWIREHRGIYRLALFPTTDRPELVLWALWSRNRNEEVEGVYSHHTALSLYDLSDLNPSKLHMTVPTDCRNATKLPSEKQCARLLE